MGSRPILPIKVTVTADTVLNVRDGHGDVTCEQVLRDFFLCSM